MFIGQGSYILEMLVDVLRNRMPRYRQFPFLVFIFSAFFEISLICV